MPQHRWTDWHQLTDIAAGRFAKVPSSPGAYVISLRTPLNRALATDNHGVLEVGESANLCRRIRAFWRCATGEAPRGHSAGYRYHRFGFSSRFPPDRLWVRWAATESKEAAHTLESQQLTRYLKRFGELPPLNSQLNWRHLG